MGGRATAVMAAVTLILGLYVWLERTPGSQTPLSLSGDILEPAPRRPTVAIQPLLRFTPADVTNIRLERAGQVLEAERQSGGWRETEPPGAIDEFLKNMAQMGILSEIPATSGDLKDYGLEPPNAIVRLQFGDHPPLSLAIGDRNPATTGVYARVADGPVILAGALVEWEFDKVFKALAARPQG